MPSARKPARSPNSRAHPRRSVGGANDRGPEQFQLSAVRAGRQPLRATGFHEPVELGSGQDFYHPGGGSINPTNAMGGYNKRFYKVKLQ